MTGFWNQRRRRRRRRSNVGGWTAFALLAAAGTVGGLWVAKAHPGAPAVQFIKGPQIRGRILPVRHTSDRPAPAAFQAELDKIAARYGEPVGLSVTDVTDGWTASVAGDETFPQQSVSKLWVALTALQAVDEGRLTLDKTVVLGPEDRSVFYQPMTARIRGSKGVEVTVADLLRHALIESDNAANDKLVQEVGGADVIASLIAKKGLDGVAVGGTERDLQTRTAGLQWKPEYGQTWIFKQAREQLPEAVRDQALAVYLASPPDGATPNGITSALAALHRGQLLSPDSTAFMLGLMGEARTGQLRMRAALPQGWALAHKTGTGPDWRGASVGINDVGLFTAPDGHTYAVAAMIRQTKRNAAARHAFMQSVTRAVAAQWASREDLPAPGRQIAASDAGPQNGL